MKTEHKTKFKICIIGGGLVGSYSCLVARIKNPNALITVIEIGPPKVGLARKDLELVPRFEKRIYQGASGSRYFGLGGTSSLWSGQLIPYPRIEKNFNANFEKIIEICEKYSAQVLHTLGISGKDKYFEALDSGENFLRLSSIWINPFKRNFSKYLKFADVVLTSSLIVDYKLRGEELEGVVIQDEFGKVCEVKADLFVITAGAIESGRIVLEISDRIPNSHLRSLKALTGLSDHITFPMVKIHDWARYPSLLNIEPKFYGLNLISYRFVPKLMSRSIYLDFLFNYQSNPTLLALLKYIAALQKDFTFKNLVSFRFKDLLKMMQIGVTCIANRRLPNSKELPIYLHCAYSQNGQLNQISLAEDKEACGRKKLQVMWEIDTKELKDIYDEVYESTIQLMKLLKIEKYTILTLEEIQKIGGNYSPFDVAHPAGITPLNSEILDNEFRILGLKNVYTISSAVLPDPGTVNPTFSLLCITHFLFHQILLKKHS